MTRESWEPRHDWKNVTTATGQFVLLIYVMRFGLDSLVPQLLKVIF
jgi:hypothetical protein